MHLFFLVVIKPVRSGNSAITVYDTNHVVLKPLAETPSGLCKGAVPNNGSAIQMATDVAKRLHVRVDDTVDD